MFNNKKFIFALGALLLLGAATIWVYNNFYLSSKGGEDLSVEGNSQNFSSEEQAADYIGNSQSPEVPAGIGQEAKIYIQGSGGTIEVNNFYKKALAIIEDSQVVIYRSSKFDVDFLRTSSEFILTINETPIVANLDEAGKYLIENLGIGSGDLCKLKFLIVLSDKVNSSEKYSTLPLCASVLK
jgi:hypothetical protein